MCVVELARSGQFTIPADGRVESAQVGQGGGKREPVQHLVRGRGREGGRGREEEGEVKEGEGERKGKKGERGRRERGEGGRGKGEEKGRRGAE